MSGIDQANIGGGQGGLEAAARTSREMATWNASPLPMDMLMRFDKDTVDDRSRDAILNDGYAAGASAIHKDNIVGSQFRLNARPDVTALGIDDEEWLANFQRVVESRFNSAGESIRNWFDASGRNDFTGLIRLAVGMYLIHGEVLATAEWLRQNRRPFHTAIQFINPRRLCNPNGIPDSKDIIGGVYRDYFGRATAYSIMQAHPFDFSQPEKNYSWKKIDAETPWGRPQVIHIIEQVQPEQVRGISDMVAVLKQMRMTRRFQDVELQQAILQASYAATIESDLPAQMVAELMGQNPAAPDFDTMGREWLSSVGRHAATRNLRLDGVKIPVMYPNTKLNLQQLGQPAGVGSSYEQSLLRHTAAGLGLSYEQFSRDYTQTNYSSARASMNETYKFMQSRKRLTADTMATYIYRLWLEEQFNKGTIPLPGGKDLSWLYSDPFHMDALSRCSWIGAGRGQIDEMKETQASILRVKFGLSTMELEAAKAGLDWRELLEQRKREQEAVRELGVVLSDGAEKEVISKKATKGNNDESENSTADASASADADGDL